MRSRKYALSALISAPFLVGLLIGSAVTGVGAAMRGSQVFTDVPSGSYFDVAVGELYGAGIVKGRTANTYDPSAPVSRAEVAVLLKRLRDELTLGSVQEEPGSTGTTGTTRSAAARTIVSRSRSSAQASSAASVAGGSVIKFSVDGFSIVESSPRAAIGVDLIRGAGVTGEVTVRFRTVDVTTTVGSDYMEATGTLVFAAGETNKPITISLREDSVGEPAETFKVILSDVTGGATLGTPSEATITLLDNDGGAPAGSTTSSAAGGSTTSAVSGAGTLGFNATMYGVMENEGSMAITVARTGGTQGAVSVNYATSNGTAQAGTHYQQTSGTLNFANGEASKTFTVSVTDNGAFDGNRTVNLTLSAPSGGAALGSTNTAVLTIVDDETSSAGSGSFIFTSGTYIATKGGNFVATVRRVGGHTGTFSINYATSDGSGIAGTDYTATSGTFTFGPGEVTKTFLVPVPATARSERTFNLTLSSPSSGGGTLGTTASAIVTIQ